MSSHLTDRILVPIANEDDAIRTAAALGERLDPKTSTLHVIHVIEKAGGAPDKAPLRAREQQAEEVFDIIRTHFDTTDYTVDTELRYGTDVPDEILVAAENVDATAIAFVPRPGGPLSALLAGNLTDRLVANDQFPVIVLPQHDDNAEA